MMVSACALVLGIAHFVSGLGKFVSLILNKNMVHPPTMMITNCYFLWTFTTFYPLLQHRDADSRWSAYDEALLEMIESGYAFCILFLYLNLTALKSNSGVYFPNLRFAFISSNASYAFTYNRVLLVFISDLSRCFYFPLNVSLNNASLATSLSQGRPAVSLSSSWALICVMIGRYLFLNILFLSTSSSLLQM